ncbi:MAG TPA: hypothetical protein VGK02_09960 [Candidatus Aquicultor sp.]|jgi:hypothetical protein
MKTKIVILSVVGALIITGGLTALSFANAAQQGAVQQAPVKVQAATQDNNQTSGVESATTQDKADAGKEVKDANETSGTEAVDAQEKGGADKDINEVNDNSGQESATEKKGEVQEDKNLPGGGHQDAEGTNADHQFEGVE